MSLNRLYKLLSAVDNGMVMILSILICVTSIPVRHLDFIFGTKTAVLLANIVLITGVVFFSLAVLAFIQLGKSTKKDDSNRTGQYATPNIVEFMRPYSAGTIADDEKIQGWFGSMSRNDLKGLGGSILLKEKVSAENTLIATQNQIIALQINREDAAHVQSGTAKTLDTVIDASSESAHTKKEQFGALYENKWPVIIANLESIPLKDALTNRFYYSISYEQLDEVVFRRSFFNPGIRLNLRSGESLIYTGFSPKRVDMILPSLADRVKARKARTWFLW